MLQRLGAVYLIAVSVAVAAYFIINPLHVTAYDPENIWFILDILMVVAAALALAYNTKRKLRGEAKVEFYATIGVTILLLHNWFSNLALGLDVGDHQGFVKWAVVDTVLPLIFGATGYAMWRDAS